MDEIEATTGVDIQTVTADAGYAYAKVYGLSSGATSMR